MKGADVAVDAVEVNGKHPQTAPMIEVPASDLNLPRKNGEELHEDFPNLSRIPIIILTSSQAEEDIVRSYELQANAYMTKPVDPEEFIDTIQTFKSFWLDIVRLPPDEDQ